MQLTFIVDDAVKLAALSRATAAYNERNAPVSEQEFLRKLVDGQLSNLVAAYAVAEMDKIKWLKERFTATERANIRTAAMTNGQIADLCALVDGASVIHFHDPVTIGGIAALEAEGLLGPGRGAEILAM